MEFVRLYLRRHLAGKAVVASPNVGCFLRLGLKGFNQQNITPHGLYVDDDARLTVGFLCRCCMKFPDGKFFFLTSDDKLNFSPPLNFD